MPEAGLQELLEAGVHFGHQTRRWNQNMRRFIHGELDGIHIIDLLQTEALLENARRFAGELASGGGTVLFVGTKKQARDSVKEWADRCKMPYVNQRWLGGLLTNFNTMSARIARLHELLGWQEEGKLQLLPTKERMRMQAELAKLEFNLGGVRDMDRLPDAVFVTDLKTEEIAVHEAARLRIPIIGLVDTNCDPNPIDYVIPGNDDAIRSCQLIIGTIGAAVETGSSAWRVQEERRIAEEMARRKKDEEERLKREEEEKVRVAAEEAAKKAAAEAEAAKQAAAAQAAPAQGSDAQAAGPVVGDGGALRAGASSTPPSPTPPAGGASEAKAGKLATTEKAPPESAAAEKKAEESAAAAKAPAEGSAVEAKADEAPAAEEKTPDEGSGDAAEEGGEK
jgi:small subunit ribosomal protein S2